ncbi:MAG: hypothetical protein Q4C76_04965 [Bacillota bacterium]|nr:hypothetical protein [Bacillota bacterium]
MRTSDVFGVSRTLNPCSYVDRANLDARLSRILNRDVHVALKGASKSGKSWLRQKVLGSANVVQCRLGKCVEDIYVEALGNLGVSIEISHEKKNQIKGTLDASGELGIKILAKLSGTLGMQIEHSDTSSIKNLYFNLDNLKFIADTINASGRRLVIEDFHYLDLEQRKQLAFDLKTLWDYGCFVAVVGIWSQSNLLTSLNPDLTGRIEEVSVFWNEEDLRKVVDKGCGYLNLQIDKTIIGDMINDSYGNVGILQKLLLHFIEDESGIEETSGVKIWLTDFSKYESAAKYYANQLNGLYQQLAKTLSRGIRKRAQSTGIYAITLQIIMDSDDKSLLDGISRDSIHEIAYTREPRIKKGNLRSVMRKLEELQLDDANRNLVLSYDESTDSMYAVDRQLLFYRKYLSVKWPWEEMYEDAVKESLFADLDECDA